MVVVAALVVLLLCAAGADARHGTTRAAVWVAPSLDEALDAAVELPRLCSLLASWHGALVLERYFNGASATRGIDRGFIPGPDTPLSTSFPSS